jgi:HSP90 family molecular chaperone
LCDFHREQAWERWLKATHNGIGKDKDEVLHILRSIARSRTVEEFELSATVLKVML